jgi:predicted transposase YbfD/YdcC
MVSAWAASNRLVPGQIKVADKSNEVTAIPQLIKVLALKDYLVTIDAMYCPTAIARQIREAVADWPGLSTLVRVRSQVYQKLTGKTTEETRYYIKSIQLIDKQADTG